MEKKNTVLLTVIAVATLLVAVVGATFAYFTATNTVNDQSNGNVTINTASVESVSFTTASITGSDTPIYPGTANYIGASATASLTAAGARSYDVTYNVSGSVTLSEAFAFPVTWTLYSADIPVAEPVSCTEVANTTSGTEVRYTQTCTVSNSLTATSATGTISAGQTSATVSLTGEVLNSTTGTTGTSKYYYLVFTYPNDSTASQNADQGKSITGAITSITATSTALHTGA